MSLIRRDLIRILEPTSVFNILRSQSFVRSDSAVDSFFNQGLVELNGQIISKSCSVNSSDSLVLLTPQELEPKVNVDYEIIFEDDYILVVNKPANLPIHPAGKYYFNSLTSILKLKFPNVDLRPVHRLDRETSGLVVFAKSKQISKILFKSFRSQEVEKKYLAIVHGVPKKTGSFKFPLVESSFGDIRNAVLPVTVGKITQTNYVLVSKSSDNLFSLLELTPKSGKKHQLRVHLSTAGFPIVGDKQYGLHPEKLTDYFLGQLSEDSVLDLWISPRHLLHCKSISFKHPKSLKLVFFESKIAKDFSIFLNSHQLTL